MPAKPLKFLALADIHIGNRQDASPVTRFPERARSLLRYVVSRSNDEFKPDFVVQLGDLIESEDEETDEEHLESAADVLGGFQAPVLNVIGNEEQRHLKLNAVLSALKLQRPYHSFKLGNFHFVCLFGEVQGETVSIGKEQMLWFEQEIFAAQKPVIVFSHFPLHDVETDEGPSAQSTAPAKEETPAARPKLTSLFGGPSLTSGAGTPGAAAGSSGAAASGSSGAAASRRHAAAGSASPAASEGSSPSCPGGALGFSSEARATIRGAIAKSGNVRAVFSGSLHKNDLHEIAGVYYVALQSLVQNISDTRPLPSESFAIVKLFENETVVEIEGMAPAEFRF